MTHLSNINEVNKIVRKSLLTQSNLGPNLVLSALEIHGTDLDEYLHEDQDIWTSFETSEAVILFELIARQSQSDVSYTEDDDSLIYNKSFTVHCIVYGNSSLDVATKLVARFRTDKTRQALYDSGVYLEKVSNPQTINEFKNETVWLRNDIDIDIACELKCQQIDLDYELDRANFTIKTIGE